ncbi:MAG: carD [Proteobacteria bacterium]|nr:carD [Pseudomonadota bacterium]
MATAKKPAVRNGFKTNEHIVYPAHGVVIVFEKDKMTLRVPMAKAEQVGMRKLAEDDIVDKALEIIKGRARVKRTMWSRRAQEYEAKINSGDLVAISEVVRDLHRASSQPEQSYSERQLYEAALDRMAREISAVSRITETEAIRRIEDSLNKSPKRIAARGDAAEDVADESEDEAEAA